MTTEEEQGDSSSSGLDTLAVGGAVLFGGMIIQLGLGFLGRAAIARELGQFDYGAVSLGRTLLVTATAVSLLGVNLGIGRHLPRLDDVRKRRGVVVSGIQLAIPASLVVTLAIVTQADRVATTVFGDPTVAPSLRVFGLAVPLAVMMKLAIGAAQGAQESVPKVVIRNVALPVSQLGFIVFALLIGGEAVSVSWAYFGSYLVAGTLGVYYLLRHSPLSLSSGSAGFHRDLLSFSLPLMLVSVMELVFEQLDTYIIWYYSNVETVGVYQAVYPLATLLTVVLISFRFIAMPVLSGLHEDNADDQMKALYQTVSKWILVATAPLFLAAVVFPEASIALTFGPKYTGGAIALQILAVGFLTHAVLGLNGATLTAVGRTRAVFVANAIAAVVNLLLNFLLIPKYPLVGAAVATTAAYVLLNVGFSAYLYVVTRISPFTWDFARLGVMTTVLIGVWSPLSSLVRNEVGLLIPVLGLYGLVYFTLSVRYARISEAERRLVAQLETKLGRDLDSARQVVSVLRR
ncbi:oligosaccharide flippase family protein [Haloarchaeobius iranensis]|uniref:Membrane protein involved in the export of O-antigen and teichoic acid n=1 Tax=Haloarchaeobius iranensis TaxID=996166 RepID=A0A1H0BU41_9EURY|nr:oligosaccharide flippase family protein [Haloarchaeobius iranensis]SDN49159.1 Membrane protein involved in the export of O-antigen and teichoic acid [Haloarchaeobius iranensis]